MRSTWLVIPLVFAVQLAAHGTEAQPAAAAPIPNQAITVTGCVQANPAGSGGGPSSTANAPATVPAGSTPYVLANANKRPADADAAAAAPAGASGAASGRPSNAVGTGGTTDVTSYALHGRADELAAHVGHRVEITGTASETAPSAEVAAGAPQQQVVPHEPQRGPVSTVASPDASGRTAHPSVQHLSVQSVRMLDATCK
jgi:hypothetical protein